MTNTRFIYFSDRILLDSRDYCDTPDGIDGMEKFWNKNELVLRLKAFLDEHSIPAQFVIDITKDGQCYDGWRDCVYYLFLVFDDPNDLLRFKLAWS